MPKKFPSFLHSAPHKKRLLHCFSEKFFHFFTSFFFQDVEIFARACYNSCMEIRKIAGIALAFTVAVGAFCAPFPFFENTTASAEDAAAQETENTDDTGSSGSDTGSSGSDESPDADVSVHLTPENAALVLPESYEQYLPLTSPSSVAMSEDYIAIADGTTLYLYDRAAGVYETYAPTQGENFPTPSPAIGTISFSDDGTLYFSVQGSLYSYDFETQEATVLSGIASNAFLIEDGYLYTGVVESSTLYLLRYPMSNLVPSAQQQLASFSNYSGSIYMTYADGILYYVTSSNTLYTYNTATHDNTGALIDSRGPVNGLSSIASFGGNIYFSVNNASQTDTYQNGLYRYTADGVTTMASGAYTALTAYNGSLYCIEGASVREFTSADGTPQFTSYEIAAASDSVGRLSGATDSARAGDLLVTADAGNKRVTIYDFSTQTYSVLACGETPSLVATDGETIAYASGTNIYTCAYGDEAFTLAETAQSSVRGLACAYGSVYFATVTLQYGVANDESAATVTYESYGIPTGMACDLYGVIYVAYESGSVRIFSESDFLTASSSAGAQTAEFTLPSDATSPEADFEGNLYYLSGGAMYRNGELFANVDGADFVWTADGTAQSPVSFALGFEDDEVYFNFGNYVVKSNAGTLAGIPTLDEIAVGDAKETAFSFHEAEGMLVSVPAGTVGISTDLAALREDGSDYFPYGGYARSAEERQGILLAVTGGYALVLFSEGNGDYSSELFLADRITAIDSSQYYTPAETAYLSYLTNDVSVYAAPCLESALADTRLTRGTAVSVIGMLQTDELTYALVEYDSGTRAAVRGYVPASYLTEISPDISSGENYTLAYLRSSDEGVLFTDGADGERLITERVQVRLYDNGDGTYTARLSEDPSYFATITADMIDEGNAEIIRIALIIILTVLALVILGVYIFLLPREKYKKNSK